MIYTNLSETQLKKAIQTKIKLHQPKIDDETIELFIKIDQEATQMSHLLNRPFYECKLSLLWIENTLKRDKI